MDKDKKRQIETAVALWVQVKSGNIFGEESVALSWKQIEDLAAEQGVLEKLNRTITPLLEITDNSRSSLLLIGVKILHVFFGGSDPVSNETLPEGLI